MKRRTSYKTYLRAAGRRPLPAYDKLRTAKQPGHCELVAGKLVVHGAKPTTG